jgi:CHAD domain-containing protein
MTNHPDLEPSERAALDALARSDNAALARRAQIILGWAEGLTPAEIAGQVGLTERTVARWLSEFSRERLGIFPADVLPGVAAAPMPAVADLCRRYQVDMDHARHVARLAVELFDLTLPLHRLDSHYRDVLHTAGILHNVAFAGGIAKHHTRGRDIVLESPLADLSDADRAIVAVTTAFHRKAWKARRLEQEPSFLALPADVQPIALRLSALLRIADGLDASQSQTTLLGPSHADSHGAVATVVGPFAADDAARAEEKSDMWHALYETPLLVTPHADVRAQEAALVADITPALLRQPGILPTDSMSEAGRKVIAVHFERMLAFEPAVRAGQDVEAVHDMRVATRRLRAAFQLFGAHYTEKTRSRLLPGLRRTARALGRARDLDVFLQNVQLYLAALPAARQHEVDLIVEHWSAERQRAHETLLDFLDGKRYADLVDNLRAFAGTPNKGSRDTEDQALSRVDYSVPRLIYTYYEALRAFEPMLLNTPQIETLHALRLEAKRLRYTLEFFREVLGEDAAGVITAAVKVQDHLGALHDADVARGLLRRFLKRQRKAAEKAARRAAKVGQPPPPEPDLSGVEAYLADREQVLDRLHESFPQVWADLVSAETRRKLALAVSVL